MSVLSVVVAVASTVVSLGATATALLALIVTRWRYVEVQLRGAVVRRGPEGLWRSCEAGGGCTTLDASDVGTCDAR